MERAKAPLSKMLATMTADICRGPVFVIEPGPIRRTRGAARAKMDRMETAPGDMSDDALLLAYGAGDPRAAALLTARLTPRLMAHAGRVLGDRSEAEDVVQEAMLRLWRSAPEWDADGDAKVSTFVFRIVTNLSIDRLRKRRPKTDLDAIAEPADDAPGAEARMQQATRMDALRAALAALPERQAQAVTLRHLEGLSNPEIAEIMETGVEAVESLTARGKRSLAALLAGRKEELGYGDE